MAPTSRVGGFTLIELLVAIAVFGILVSLAVPGFRDFSRNACLTNTANAMVSGISLARAEAVRQRQPLTFGAAPNPDDSTRYDWQSGWRVWVDSDADGELDAGETIVKRYEQRCPETTIESTSATLGAPVRYEPTGNAAGRLDVFICDNRKDESGRRVVVTQLGRPEVQVLPRTGSGACAAF